MENKKSIGAFWLKTAKSGTKYIFALIKMFRCYKSEPMYENAIVLGKSYLPNTKHTVVAPNVSFNGNVGITVIDSGNYEIFTVVVKCEKHNVVFSIRSKELYSEVKEGQTIRLKYLELYKIKNGVKIIKDFETLEFETEKPKIW